jgi:hypothetical protein
MIQRTAKRTNKWEFGSGLEDLSIAHDVADKRAMMKILYIWRQTVSRF